MFSRFIPPNANPIALNGVVDNNVILAILLMVVLAGVICGALPAWRSSHVSPAEVLKDEATSVSGGAHNRNLLSGLVVAQIALSLALLITAGLFLRTLRNANETDPGFDRTHVLLSTIEPEAIGYSWNDADLLQRKLLDRLRVIPGATSVALSDWVPLTFTRGSGDAFPEGYVPRPHESMEVRRASVTGGYFETMRIPLLEGRTFTDEDGQKSPLVAIVDQTMANHFWPKRDPVGKRFKMYDAFYTVVGVAKNSTHQQMNEPPEPLVYLSLFQFGGPQRIIHVRTAGDPQLLASPVEQAVHQLDSKLPVFDVLTLAQSIRMGSAFVLIEATFASAFAVLALILATTGIYGVVAYRTQLRTQEIGIRVALGASRSDVLKLVLYQGLRLTAAGLALGLAFSFVLTRFLRGMLYGVSASDPFTAACVTALLAVIAVLACYLPALKAMRINPVNAIRAK